MKKITGTIAFGGLIAGLASWGLADAPGAAAQSFYKGKTIKMIVRSAPGGGYDFYGRLLARHMPNHIPGKPDMIAVSQDGVMVNPTKVVITDIVASNGVIHVIDSVILPPSEMAMDESDMSTGDIVDIDEAETIGLTPHDAATLGVDTGALLAIAEITDTTDGDRASR